MDIIETAEKDGMRLSIWQDQDTESPRERDNIGTMVCFHSRYDLGDRIDEKNPTDWLFSVLYEAEIIEAAQTMEPTTPPHEDRWDAETFLNYNDKAIPAMLEIFERRAFILPLYLFDHGGITMSTGSFSCPWDSGQVGWIYATHETAREEYGDNPGEAKAKTIKYMEGEVKTFAQYIEGQVYGFTLERLSTCSHGDEHGDTEESCGGFYGYDWKENGLAEHIPEKHAHLIDLLA